MLQMGDNKWGLGAVIRDGEGNISLATKEAVHLSFESKVVEALVMRFGLQLARNTCFHRMEAESNYLDMVKALGRPCNENTYISMVVEDCKQLCELLDYFSFSHVSKVDNKFAHR